MNDANLADSPPPSTLRQDKEATTTERSRRNEPGWSRPARRGPASAIGRLLGRIFGIDPEGQSCRCVRCTLHRLGIYRREHVRCGSSAWLRTTVLGIRIRPDRYAFPLD